MSNVINIQDYQKDFLYIIILENNETVGISQDFILMKHDINISDLMNETLAVKNWVDLAEVKLSSVDFLIRSVDELLEVFEKMKFNLHVVDERAKKKLDTDSS